MKVLKQQKGKITSPVNVPKQCSYRSLAALGRYPIAWVVAWGQPGATGARGTSGSSCSPCPAIPAVLLQLLRLISAVEESAFEELHSDDSKNEHEEHVDYEDVEDILQGIHHAVKDGLRMGTRLRGCEEGRGHYPGT